tara:strand:- start:10562 stop:12925 length:2364 start_codon:yes stop_codon:yes gene_type:complete
MIMIEDIFENMEYGPALEDASVAYEWLSEHKPGFGHWIGGRWTAPTRDFRSINPANGEFLADLSQATQNEVGRATEAARSALKEWQSLSGSQRGRHLYAIARQIQKHARLFSVLETLDNGKPIRESRDIDIPLVSRHFYHHAGWASLVENEFSGSEALGVVGQIIPWNFPLLMLAWKVAPALAAGNTVVLKPAEYTSLTSLLFAEIAHRSGLPAGVLNIVTGDGEVGRFIVDQPGIDKIAFTGSTEVGREIRRTTAGSGKALTLELGGKSPFVVFSDADLDSAVEGVVDAIWFNQGEVCCAGSRLLVQESIADKFEKKLKRRMNSLRVGAPLDKAIDMGAIVDKTQLEKITNYVEIGKKEGGSCWQSDVELPNQGCFYPPTLFTGIEPSHTIACDEIFGPVLAMLVFRTHDEAVAMANNTHYGLAASVWSENINLALHVAAKLKAGVVWINSTNQFDAASGFGGYRESGFGREGGVEGLWAYRRAPADQPPDNIVMPEPRQDCISPREPSLLDKTAKMYIGGRQIRPDSGYYRSIKNKRSQLIGDIGEGNRKDIRNAVEAANLATGWSQLNGHGRAQILYFLAENLETRSKEFANRLVEFEIKNALEEVQASIDRIFWYGGWSDKYEGSIHQGPVGQMVLALPEPIGVAGLVCPDDAPLLAMVSLLCPLIAMGNTVVLIPSELCPLVATDFYQLLETSDIPPGVVNIVTGSKNLLAPVLSEHYEVDVVWMAGDKYLGKTIEELSVGNLKQTWITRGARDWFDPSISQGREFLRRATQVKNLWVPYGE